MRSTVIALTFFAALNVQAQDLRGIYVFTNNVASLSKTTIANVQAAIALHGVDGVVIDIGWDAVEPSKGQFDWTLIDQWMHTAIASGRRIDLAIMAGSSTPSWLFTAGAVPLNFTISPHSGQTGVCQSLTMAPPWDAVFLAQWDEMLAALAAHLKANGTYADVTMLRLTGINRTTEEFRLPAETPASTGLACVTDAVAIWQQAGYRPSQLTNAWTAITNSFKKSFPDKTFNVAIIPANAFPAIAEDGSVIKGTPPDPNPALLALASQKFPHHLVVQFDFLMPGEAASPEVTSAAQTLGTMAAFQTNEYFGQTGQGAACSEPVTNPTPCTATTFLQLLETGIYPLGRSNPLRAQYIEVFQGNANAFPADLVIAHDEMIAGPRRRSAHH